MTTITKATKQEQCRGETLPIVFVFPVPPDPHGRVHRFPTVRKFEELTKDAAHILSFVKLESMKMCKPTSETLT